MKKKIGNQPKIKIIVSGKNFQSAIDRYREQSILRNSESLAYIYVFTEGIKRKELRPNYKTDLFILCCDSDDKSKLKCNNDLLARAKKYGSEFFTSVVITCGNAKDEDFKEANVIFPVLQDDDFEFNVVRLLQTLVEISTKQGMSAVDFADIQTILHYRGIGFFKQVQIKEEKGSAIKITEQLMKDPVFSKRIKEAAGIIMYFYVCKDYSYEDIGRALGMLSDIIKNDCNIIFNIVDGKDENLQISFVIVDDKL